MYDPNCSNMFKMKPSPLKKQQLSPSAAKRKAARDLKYAKTSDRKAKKADSQAKRRAAKAKGKSLANMDYDHRTNRFVPVSTNRGNRGEGTKSEGSKNYRVG